MTGRRGVSAARFPAVGVGLPVLGPHATPESIRRIAQTADRLGYSTVSLSERLLLPGRPDWTNDFGLPEWPAFDTLDTLAWVAAHTERIRLRTDVIIPLFQQPVVLARRLATLDHLSGGRLDVGVGLGWMAEEFAAVGVPERGRARRFEEAIAAIRACWAPDPVQFVGEHYRIPPAQIGPKPVGSTIPIAIGALVRPAVERAARIGDGLTIGFRNWDDTIEQLQWYSDAGGRGIVNAKGGPLLTEAGGLMEREAWSVDHVIDNLARARVEGIDEFVWDLNIVGTDPDRQVELLTWLAGELELTEHPQA